MDARLHDIVSRRAALERRIERDRVRLGEALNVLVPLGTIADRAAAAVKFVHERPLLGVLIGSATGIVLRRRIRRWLPIASLATFAARAARGFLRR